jgi:streptogramin lyase
MKRASTYRHALHVAASLLFAPSLLAATISGHVVDPNGNPVANVQVIHTRAADTPGASVVTVFSGADGSFSFPGDYPYPETIDAQSDIRTRGLGLQQVDRYVETSADAAKATFVVQAVTNQVDVAPASAWLQRIADPAEKADFIMNCIDCHQVPAPEVRSYAASIADLHAGDPAEARRQSWDAIVKYMNFLSAWEFSRGQRREGAELDANAVYAVENEGAVVELLTRIFDDRLDHIEGYDWGAPIIATPATAIWEYAIPEPNATRETVMLGNPALLLSADVAANRIVATDVVTGTQRDFEVPTDYPIGPHSLHRGNDGMLWVTPLFNNTVAKLDPATGTWNTWLLKTPDGGGVGIHDLSFGYKHELLTDVKGRIWFSDIGNTGVGYFDPADGSARVWPAPVEASRAGDAALYGNASLYGLVMTKDRNEVWYSQLGNGVFGGFRIDTEEFIGPFVLPSANAGPRRISISDDDVMYMALYGTGQIAEFDIKSRTMIAIHDLPDTGSAPYALTWDPLRRVVWVATSNNDVIYRFDPATRAYGVLPLPREQTFLRMIDIDPQTGVLVASYANIVENVNGPRMALIVDPGDGVYPQQFSPATASVGAGQ